MNRGLIVGDPHIQLQKLDVGVAFFNALSDVIVKNNINDVTILGDLFHTFSVIRSEVLYEWCRFFTDHHMVVFRLLVGNHDYAGQAGGSHALEPFKCFENVIVYDEPRGEFDVLFVPFMRDNNEFIEAVKDRTEKVLLCHQSFNGAQFQNGYYDPNGVDPKHVSHFKKVISGHIHNAQEFANIWYPGAPYQHNFGEAGQPKHIHMVEFPNLGTDGAVRTESYDLGLPKYHEIKGHSLEHLRTVVKNTPRKPKDRYKIIGMGTPAEIAEFWADPEVQSFRSEVKQVVDAIIPERGRIFIDEVQGKSPQERLDAFIGNKEWRTSRDRVHAAARTVLS